MFESNTDVEVTSMNRDEDTHVLISTILDIAGEECTLEKWIWDGIEGNSVIFSAFGDMANRVDDELRSVVSSALNLMGDWDFTIIRNEKNIFVNFFDLNQNDSDFSLQNSVTQEELPSRRERVNDYVREKNQRTLNESDGSASKS